MTRDQLLVKKRELAVQIEALQKKSAAIDEVLDLFPEEGVFMPQLPGTEPYAGMTGVQAIMAFLKSQQGVFMTVGEISQGLRAGGYKSPSPNFNTIVGGSCNRLAEDNKIERGDKGGRRVFRWSE